MSLFPFPYLLSALRMWINASLCNQMNTFIPTWNLHCGSPHDTYVFIRGCSDVMDASKYTFKLVMYFSFALICCLPALSWLVTTSLPAEVINYTRCHGLLSPTYLYNFQGKKIQILNNTYFNSSILGKTMKHFCILMCPDRLWDPQNLLFSGYQVLFPSG